MIVFHFQGTQAAGWPWQMITVHSLKNKEPVINYRRGRLVRKWGGVRASQNMGVLNLKMYFRDQCEIDFNVCMYSSLKIVYN